MYPSHELFLIFTLITSASWMKNYFFSTNLRKVKTLKCLIMHIWFERIEVWKTKLTYVRVGYGLQGFYPNISNLLFESLDLGDSALLEKLYSSNNLKARSHKQTVGTQFLFGWTLFFRCNHTLLQRGFVFSGLYNNTQSFVILYLLMYLCKLMRYWGSTCW